MRRLYALALAVGIVAALAVAPPAPARAQGATKLTPFKVVFLVPPSGMITNFVASLDGGFFKQQGLDVSYIVPGNPADASKLVASGSAQIGLVHSTDVILARSRGLPIVSISATHQFGTAGVMVPIEAKLSGLKDLEGMTVGITGIPANRIMLEHMLRVNDVDLGKVKILTLGFTLAQALLAGRIQAIGDAITWSEPILYNLKTGKNANDTSTYTYMAFYENGVPRYYTMGTVTSESYMKSNPDTLRRFLRAYTQGLQRAIDRPKESVDMLVKRWPHIDKAVALGTWNTLASISVSAETRAHGLGWQSPDVWRKQAAFMLEKKLIPTAVDVSKAMTNVYLPGK